MFSLLSVLFLYDEKEFFSIIPALRMPHYKLTRGHHEIMSHLILCFDQLFLAIIL